jgi:OTU domain-containing protein 3
MTHKGKKKSAPPCSSKSNTATAKNNHHASNKSREKRSRRQANKWQESSDDSDTNFRASLLNQGYTIKEMNGDGNCLFRSLADQLSYLQHSCVIGASNNNSMHVVVRQDVCNYLSQHKEEFQHFLLMEDDDEDVFNVDQYIEKMRKVRDERCKIFFRMSMKSH